MHATALYKDAVALVRQWNGPDGNGSGDGNVDEEEEG
jgi:hypothetical protein